MKELDALVILNNISGLGPIKSRRLIDHFGSAEAALGGSPEEIQQIPGFGSTLAIAIANWKQQETWKKDLELIDKHHVEVISYDDERYPQLLKNISDPPIILYVKGNLTKSDVQALAVIGTRNCSIYGNELALNISQDLAAAGFTIVSGLARGIDTSAHKGALTRGRTIAVIGSGLANIYPKENTALSSTIERNGAVISEFPMATPPDRHHFPRRNRIVSGLSQGIVLIEAPLKSGAMITMEQGFAQGKKLFAFPARADMETFQGNHHLIKKGIAKLIDSVGDIIVEFPATERRAISSLNSSEALSINPEEKALLESMPLQEISIEDLAVHCQIHMGQIPIGKLNSLLMSLILKKIVKEYPGKIYKKIRM